MSKLHCFVIGINHRTSAVEVRDSLGVPDSKKDRVFQSIQDSPIIREMVLLSTCNRVEWYGVAEDLDSALQEVKSIWSQVCDFPESQIEDEAYYYSHGKAVEHLFRVACSLDSLVIGEGQILGQVKSAYYRSAEGRTTGLYLNHLFQKAISLGKRVRTETGINQGAVSISFAAVEICKKVFQDFKSKKALIVGVGEMARLAATHLVDAGIQHLVFANRTVGNTSTLCERFQAQSMNLGQMIESMSEFDIIISCTGAPHAVIQDQDIAQSVTRRKYNTQVFVDIAAPRDIDAGDDDHPGAVVFSIDDLKNVVDENRQKRAQASEDANLILKSEVIEFKNWYLSLDVVPVIKGLRTQFADTFQSELLKLKDKSTPEEFEKMERFAHSVMNKLLHTPSLELKKLGEEGLAGEGIWVVKKLFEISMGESHEEN